MEAIRTAYMAKHPDAFWVTFSSVISCFHLPCVTDVYCRTEITNYCEGGL